MVYAKLTSMNTPHDNPQHSSDAGAAPGSRRSFAEEQEHAAGSSDAEQDVRRQMRDISEVAAVEVIVTSAVHLMSAAAVKCGLGHEENAEQLKDLDEARKLITALAGFVTAAAPEIGSQHAGPPARRPAFPAARLPRGVDHPRPAGAGARREVHGPRQLIPSARRRRILSEPHRPVRLARVPARVSARARPPGVIPPSPVAVRGSVQRSQPHR
ncbi:hypothetical protein MN0502_12550 [Arthrobacter sp. MN05-02]|nr:hypothetical protein MN0502_12550 [Arthrobacter sp. MN05-02]